MDKKILIIGHRGASLEASENTIESFEKAIEIGADSVEFDVQQTKDGHLVVIHNAEFTLSDNTISLVSENDLSSLKQYFPKLPLLQEVLGVCKGRCKMEVELKRQNIDYINSCLQVLYKHSDLSDIEVTSSFPVILQKIKQLEPSLKTGVFFSVYPEWKPASLGELEILEMLDFIDAEVAHLPLSIINNDFSHKLWGKGKRVHAADCNTRIEINKAIELQVDQISTNDPRLAMSLVN